MNIIRSRPSLPDHFPLLRWSKDDLVRTQIIGHFSQFRLECSLTDLMSRKYPSRGLICRISKVGDEGPVVAAVLVSWTCMTRGITHDIGAVTTTSRCSHQSVHYPANPNSCLPRNFSLNTV